MSRKGTALDKAYKRTDENEPAEEMHKLISRSGDRKCSIDNRRLSSGTARERMQTPCFSEQKAGFMEKYFGPIEHEVVQMKNSLHEMADILNMRTMVEQQTRSIAREWRTVAAVLDRIFFLIYIIAIASSLIVLFPRPTE